MCTWQQVYNDRGGGGRQVPADALCYNSAH